MIKKVFFSSLFTLITSLTFAQPGSVIWSDDFSVPSNWVIDNTGQTYSVYDGWTGWTVDSIYNNDLYYEFPFQSISGGNFAELKNNYNAQNVTYTLTTASAIPITANEVTLKFNQNQLGGIFFDSLHSELQQVQISTDGVTWISVADNSDMAGLSTYPPTTTLKSVDLSSFVSVGATAIWIRFRWTWTEPTNTTTNSYPLYGNYNVDIQSGEEWDSYGWLIDDVELVNNFNYDLQSTSSYWGSQGLNYYQIPLAQVAPIDFSVNLTNVGNLTMTNCLFKVDVNSTAWLGLSNFSTISSQLSDSLFTTTQFTPSSTTTATYTINRTLISTNSDEVSYNNELSPISFSTTNYIYARDNGTIDGEVYSPYSGKFETGNLFHIFNDQIVTGINTIISNGGGADEIYVKIYSIDPSTGNFVEVATSGINYLTNEGFNMEISIPLSNPITLLANTTYLAVVGTENSNYFSVSTAGISDKLTSFYYDTADSTWYYQKLTPCVRLNFQPICSDVNVYAGDDVTVCQGDPVVLYATSTPSASSIEWNYAGSGGNYVNSPNAWYIPLGTHNMVATAHVSGNYGISTVDCVVHDTLHITVLHPTYSFINHGVCPSELPYTWNGNDYTTAGTYTFNTVNSNGCDSTANLILTINAVDTNTTNMSICPSELPYMWNNITCAAAGSYTYSTTTSTGCDSIAILNLALNTNTYSSTTIAICPSSIPYTWNGNQYTSAGTYTYTTTNSVGCDSVAILILSVSNAALTSTTTQSICSTDLPYVWNGNSYTASGTYTYATTTSAGCDSTVTLILSVNSNNPSTSNITVCPAGLPYVWNGNSYNAAGTYTYSTTTSAGCDSVAILMLSINNVLVSTTSHSVCPSDLPYVWNGNSYTSAGTYTYSTTTNVGCDSIATLILTVNTVLTSTTNQTVCSAELPYVWNNIEYTAAGTYTYTTMNSSGCDSIAILSLSVNQTPASPVLTCNDTVICAGETTSIYSNIPNSVWSNGETGDSIAVTQTGNYTATVTANGCTSPLSNEIVIDVCSGIEDLKGSVVSIYPNPAKDILHVSLSGNSANLTILTIDGKALINSTIASGNDAQFDVSSYSTGMYLLSVTTDGKTLIYRFEISQH